MNHRIWITWENQRRNRSLSSVLKAKLFELNYDSDNPLLRYAKCILSTLKIFIKEKPSVVFVQNPSIILATVALIASKCFRFHLIVDAHNGGVNPKDRKSRFLNLWAALLLRYSPNTIITNSILKDEITIRSAKKPRLFILPDPIPVISKPSALVNLSGQDNILFICTWAIDEPYMEVIKAAKKLPKTVHIYVTGNYKKANIDTSQLPSNVTLTGFISNEEFDQLLYSADIIMDLTTREGCLVCGAYESIAVGKPLILSDTLALRKYFRCMTYTKNNSLAICQAITSSIENKKELTEAAVKLKEKLNIEWDEMKEELEMPLP